MREHFNDGVEFLASSLIASSPTGGSQQRGGADLHHVVRGSADDDGDVFHAFADSGIPWHGRVDQTFIFRNFVPSAGEAVETYLKVSPPRPGT